MRGRIHAETMYQDKTWFDAEGVEHDLEKMDPVHRSRLIPFLERRARGLQFVCGVYTSRILPDLATASDGVFNALYGWEAEFEGPPLEWLHATPLMRKLKELEFES